MQSVSFSNLDATQGNLAPIKPGEIWIWIDVTSKRVRDKKTKQKQQEWNSSY